MLPSTLVRRVSPRSKPPAGKEQTMNPVVAKVLKKTLTTSTTVVGALFVVYFWNLDQKLMG